MRGAIVTLGLLMLLAIPVGVAAQTAPIRCGPEAGPTPAPQCYSGPTAIEIVNPDAVGVHFIPPRAFVQVGTTITWTNGDYETHTVTADDGSFASGPLEYGQQFTHTFEFAGGFAYHCDYHPNPSTSPGLIPRVIVTT